MKTFSFALPLLAAVLVARATYADDILRWDPSDTRLHADAMLGFGTDNLNLGIGVRAGETLANHFWLGGLLVYHAGTSSNASVNGVLASSSVSGLYVGPEAGYELQLAAAPIAIRPYLGLGLADAFGSTTVAGMTTSASSSQLAFWLGAATLYRLNSSVVVGGDLRIASGQWGTSVGLFATCGMYFGS